MVERDKAIIRTRLRYGTDAGITDRELKFTMFNI